MVSSLPATGLRRSEAITKMLTQFDCTLGQLIKNNDSCVILEVHKLIECMNKRQQLLHMLLALLIVVSIVVINGHNYSHSQAELTSCQLCVHHGSSNDAIAPEIDSVYFAPVLATIIQTKPPVQLANNNFYSQLSRAPPRTA